MNNAVVDLLFFSFSSWNQEFLVNNFGNNLWLSPLHLSRTTLPINIWVEFTDFLSIVVFHLPSSIDCAECFIDCKSNLIISLLYRELYFMTFASFPLFVTAESSIRGNEGKYEVTEMFLILFPVFIHNNLESSYFFYDNNLKTYKKYLSSCNILRVEVLKTTKISFIKMKEGNTWSVEDLLLRASSFFLFPKRCRFCYCCQPSTSKESILHSWNLS